MLKKIFGAGFGVTTTWVWFYRGTVETWFFEEVVQVTPLPSWSVIVEFGPPLLFAVLTLWLLAPERWWNAAYDWPPSPLHIRLQKAARRCYEASESGGLQDLFYGSSETAAAKLSTVVDAFAVQKYRIYARRPPSTVLRLIPEKELPSLHAVDGRNELVPDFAAETHRYIDARLDRRDFRKHIEFLRRLAKGIEC